MDIHYTCQIYRYFERWSYVGGMARLCKASNVFGELLGMRRFSRRGKVRPKLATRNRITTISSNPRAEEETWLEVNQVSLNDE